MKEFEYLEHTADVKFFAKADTLGELLQACAEALCNTMIELNEINGKHSKIIEVKAQSAEELLHNFLEELLFDISTQNMIFCRFEIKIEEHDGNFACIAKCFGDHIDKSLHQIKNEIKAVTYNEYFVKKENNEWKAQIVLDV